MTELRKTSRVQRAPAEGMTVAIGEWYWVKVKTWDGETERQLRCVTAIGSNYAELDSPHKSEVRVHFKDFDAVCERELAAHDIVQREIATRRASVERMLGEVRLLTEHLAVSVAPGDDTQAIALYHGRPVEEYKQALVKANEKTLPELFKQIEEENKAMARWMSAELLPLRAQAKALRPLQETIKARIFNVELYAGLVEQVVPVRDGAPAAAAEPVRLFQRMHYMDEECLLHYKAGGMEFQDMPAFDRWLTRRDNLSRLLPSPRCVVAFRVRRNDKRREFANIGSFIRFILSGEGETDRWTYLYIRNGERVYRLRTGIEFNERLFPDVEMSALLDGQALYAHQYHDTRFDNLITESHYQSLKAEHAQRLAEHAREMARKRNDPKHVGGPWDWEPRDPTSDYIKYSPESVYYDDITAYVRRLMDQHNRLVLVLQGLLDRSEVFHPHPRYQLWEEASFRRAIELVYDDSRALTPGKAPDFEAYRARLNARIKAGSMTIGQEDFWERREAEKYNRNHYSPNYHPNRYRPYGDPGPGLVAEVARVRRDGSCLYRWSRPRRGYARSWIYARHGGRPGDDMPRTITVPRAELFNVSAYTPGDFRRFYEDPRTRADYLQWAPLLLAAEDWHAQQRKTKGSKR